MDVMTLNLKDKNVENMFNYFDILVIHPILSTNYWINLFSAHVSSCHRNDNNH